MLSWADPLDQQRFLPTLEREGLVRKYDIDERLQLCTVGQPSVHDTRTIFSQEISCVSVGRSRPTTCSRSRDSRRTRLPLRHAQGGRTLFAVIERSKIDVCVSIPSQTLPAHRTAPGIALQCKEPAMLHLSDTILCRLNVVTPLRFIHGASRCVSSTGDYTSTV